LLFLTIHLADGSPLPLSEIVQSSLFHSLALEQTEITPFALSTSAAPFPLLSQGEHPTTGQPCWYFHPCESAASVREVMNEVSKRERSEEERWLEAWMMVVGTVVNWTD
jgi:ubiquitin-like-conjugating enzyme ATG10